MNHKPATVRLELRPEPGWRHDENRRLAAALKALLRCYGWRCVKVEDLPPPDAQGLPQGRAGAQGDTAADW